MPPFKLERGSLGIHPLSTLSALESHKAASLALHYTCSIPTTDAENHLPAGVELACFLRYTTLYQSVHTIGDVPESSRTLQSAFDTLAAWSESWKISFGPSKSQTLQISPSHREPWPTLTICNLNQTIIYDQSSLQLLGVSFDSALSYRCHIRSIAVPAN